MRTLSLNAQDLVRYQNPRHKSHNCYVAHQVFPENSNFLRKVYEQGTQNPNYYLLLDLHPRNARAIQIIEQYIPRGTNSSPLTVSQEKGGQMAPSKKTTQVKRNIKYLATSNHPEIISSII